MTALFVKDEELVHPRYLHIFLGGMRNDLLVPLMCGATNVTMNSDQLLDVVVPVPTFKTQEEVVNEYVLAEKSPALVLAAEELRDSSSDGDVQALARRMIQDTQNVLERGGGKTTIEMLLPSAAKGNGGSNG